MHAAATRSSLLRSVTSTYTRHRNPSRPSSGFNTNNGSSSRSTLKALSFTGLFSTSALSYSPFSQKMTPKDLAEDAISSSALTIFSKSYCPYCQRVKSLIAEEYPHIKPRILELDEIADGAAIQEYLLEKTGQRTVPNIFIKQEHIGGCDNIVLLDTSGELAKLLPANTKL